MRREWTFSLFVAIAHTSLAFGQAPPATTGAPEEPPPRLEATGQFTFLNTQGNASAQSLGAGGTVTWRLAPWTYSAKALFAQNESDDELTARSVAATFRASRSFTTRVALYGQYDFLRDMFAGVDQRHVTDGGMSYMAIDRRPHRFQLDGGVGYLNQQGADEDVDSATLSFGAAYKLSISSNSEFTYEPRFLQPLGDSASQRFDHAAALTVAMNSVLSFKLAHILRYSADPPADFKKTDRITSVSLVAKVRRP